MKLKFARFAIQTLAPEVQKSGVHHGAQPTRPSHWVLERDGLIILFTQNVLLAPTEASTSNVIDIFPAAAGEKLFSVSWEPQRPFIPPEVICFRRGDWMAALGFAGPE